VATSTLANFPNSHPPLAETVRPCALPNYPKPQPEFRVFPTGEAEYCWRIVALATSQIISRHKSLSYAVRKCTRLNGQRDEVKLDPLKVALSGFPDVNSYPAYYEGVRNEFD
jgi:hypothetical protein